MPHISANSMAAFTRRSPHVTTTRKKRKGPKTLKVKTRNVQRKTKRDIEKAMVSLKAYEELHPLSTSDPPRDMMNIIEEVSEKGHMNDHQYITLSNHLLTMYKQQKKSEEISQVERRYYQTDTQTFVSDYLRYALEYSDLRPPENINQRSRQRFNWYLN